MNAPNFSSVLDKPSSAIQKPKPFPVGSYIGVVKGPPKIDKSTKKQTEYSEYTIQVTQALSDVDEEALAAFGDIGQKTVRATFYHTDDSIYRLAEFLDHCDIPRKDDNGEDLTTRQRIPLVPNCTVGINIIHKVSDDGENVYANVNKTFKPE